MTRTALTLLLLLAAAANAQTADAPVLTPRPRILEAQEGAAPPAGYRAATRPRIALMATGGGAFVGAYAINLGVTLTLGAWMGFACVAGSHSEPCDTSWALGFIPFAGPVLLASLGSLIPMWFAVTLTSVQTLGAGLAIAAAFLPKHVWVLEKNSGRAAVTLEATPLGVRGQF
jgi:hypothetical protein